MHRSLLALFATSALLLAGCSGSDAQGVPLADPVAGFGEPVGAIECDRGGHDSAYHIHAILAVILPDGTHYQVPESIGMNENCMYWAHTHDTDVTTGQIHVEAPAETAVTLADFLEIWRRSTNPTIPDAVAAGLAEIRVAGELVADPKSVVLSDILGIEITLKGYPQR